MNEIYKWMNETMYEWIFFSTPSEPNIFNHIIINNIII